VTDYRQSPKKPKYEIHFGKLYGKYTGNATKNMAVKAFFQKYKPSVEIGVCAWL
jgi:hypothetical protein